MKSVIELATEIDIEFAHDRIHEMPLSYEDDREFRLRWLERFAEAVRAEREWVDLTDDEIDESWCIEPKPINGLLVAEPVKQEPVGYTNKEQLRLLKDPRNPIGMWTTPFQTNNVPLYAAPVSVEAAVLAEREMCAKVADGELMNTNMLTSYPRKSSAAWNIAAAIRARSEK